MNSSHEEKDRYNRLIREKSPYLLQHAENPVNWYPWGKEAFESARQEEKPIFLSIGYATCHWCHVMAHESFEDEEVAQILNRSFISIKVDREERPDIDHIYMSVCQGLTGQGGWPLSIFMTAEGNPFFAGTYFPKVSRMGMMGFIELLNRIVHLWASDRQRILTSGEGIRQALRSGAGWTPRSSPLGPETLRKAYDQLALAFDPAWGGFGQAPKFPTPHHLNFLLRFSRRSGESHGAFMVEKTLLAMRQGGMFDQIGLGFHRYSVDEKWLVPHFEKMLYDQALLALAYTEAYQALGKEEYRKTAQEIFTYVLRDMTSPEGGFYSAEDADSEGKEGLFYVWTPRQLKKHLRESEGDLFCRFYGITDQGNFEDGVSILHQAQEPADFARKEGMVLTELTAALEQGRLKLFAAREKRVRPLMDDKILTSWNGLMIAALAKGQQAFQIPAYGQAAQRAADFILGRLVGPQGRLFRRYRQGDIAHAGFLDDYAFLVWGLIELYETVFEPRYLQAAIHLNQIMIENFWDEDQGGFFFTPKDGEGLITRPKNLYDGATPSGNSVALLNLLRLGRMTGNVNLEKRAERMLLALGSPVAEHPMAYTQFLCALDFVAGPSREIVIAGDPKDETTQAMVALIQKTFLPNKVMLLLPDGSSAEELLRLCPDLKNMLPLQGKTAAYICTGFSCQNPITDLEELRQAFS